MKDLDNISTILWIVIALFWYAFGLWGYNTGKKGSGGGLVGGLIVSAIFFWFLFPTIPFIILHFIGLSNKPDKNS